MVAKALERAFQIGGQRVGQGARNVSYLHARRAPLCRAEVTQIAGQRDGRVELWLKLLLRSRRAVT